MKKKQASIINKLSSCYLIFALLILWQVLSGFGIVPKYLLPSPLDVVKAFINDFPLIMHHAGYTLSEAVKGLSIGVAIGFVLAILMDSIDAVKKAVYPLIILTQTIPTVAIAPLLVLWMGYGQAPKVALIALTSFFPVAISLLDGFNAVDPDSIKLLKAMGADKWQIYRQVKIPASTLSFFSGLRISVSYAVVGAVVAEWLGGFHGLGVYMTRARKSYAFDKMFAIIFFISFLSLFCMGLLKLLEKRIIKWRDIT